MFCVVIQSEIPAVVGPFRTAEKADAIADQWNADNEHADLAVVERMLTYQEAEKEMF